MITNLLEAIGAAGRAACRPRSENIIHGHGGGEVVVIVTIRHNGGWLSSWPLDVRSHERLAPTGSLLASCCYSLGSSRLCISLHWLVVHNWCHLLPTARGPRYTTASCNFLFQLTYPAATRLRRHHHHVRVRWKKTKKENRTRLVFVEAFTFIYGCRSRSRTRLKIGTRVIFLLVVSFFQDGSSH